MTGEDLYHAIKSLSEKEANFFLKWALANTPRKNPPKYISLFERIRNIKDFEEVEIKKGLFKSASLYIRNRATLIEKMIECFAFLKGSGDLKLNKIITALDFHALEFAKSYLSEEIENAFQKENYSYCNYLVDIALKYQDDYQVSIYDGKGEYSASTIKARYYRLEELFSARREAIPTLKKGFFEKAKAASRIRKLLLGSISSSEGKILFWEKKLDILALNLEGKYDEEFLKQESLTENLLEHTPSYLNITEFVKELSLGVIAALWHKSHEKVARFNLALSRINTTSVLEERQKDRLWIKRSIDAAYQFSDSNLMERAIEALLDSKSLFTIEDFNLRILFGAVTYITCGKYKRAKVCIREIRKSPKSEWGELTWQPEVLRMVASFLEGSLLDDWETLSRSIKRSLDKEESEFPWLIIDTLNQIIHKNPGTQIDPIAKKALAEFNQLIKNPKEKRQSLFFDFPLFLQATVSGKSMLNISEDRNDATNTGAAMIS